MRFLKKGGRLSRRRKNMDAEETVISLQNIQWSQREKMILKDISWEVTEGQHWVLLGLNGSGKTSLLKMICGYQWPSKGIVSVLKQQFGKVNIQEVRKSIGWVSSSLDERFSNRSTDSALQVVLSGKHASIGIYEEILEIDIEKAKRLLAQFQVDHVTYQSFSTLSQGEKRKVMLSRALMSSPQLLILDEPCNGLDLYAKEQLLSSIESMVSLPEAPTVLYVTHHIEEVVPSITHAMLLDAGEVVASGKKKDVLTSELLRQSFHLPLTVHWQEERPWVRVNRM